MSEYNSVKFRCPSNIALVKYWGKKTGGVQLPANPSISWTLSDLHATTTVTRSKMTGLSSSAISLEFFLAGESKPSFEPKIRQFLERIAPFMPQIKEFHWKIESENNFPHGTGIASSAAGFGALALCFADFQRADLAAEQSWSEEEFLQIASKYARLGSGSACRSVYGQPGIWGETNAWAEATDEFAVPFTAHVHESLKYWADAVLIVDDGEKSVSSTQGHDLLKDHPYAASRYQQAQVNLERLLEMMKVGDLNGFISLVESEALQLHAMMMSSEPYYLLIRPNTIAIIERIWNKRKETQWPMAFTLDAGANVHLLYDKSYSEPVMNFIETELLPYCKNSLYLCSDIGGSPQKI
ncbi:MAG: diphosphomevalonate decarboxylase [Bacteroidia bacterium]|nr:diphosphomevalonate decarboxylase [Bacteroidia bacterium]